MLFDRPSSVRPKDAGRSLRLSLAAGEATSSASKSSLDPVLAEWFEHVRLAEERGEAAAAGNATTRRAATGSASPCGTSSVYDARAAAYRGQCTGQAAAAVAIQRSHSHDSVGTDSTMDEALDVRSPSPSFRGTLAGRVEVITRTELPLGSARSCGEMSSAHSCGEMLLPDPGTATEKLRGSHLTTDSRAVPLQVQGEAPAPAPTSSRARPRSASPLARAVAAAAQTLRRIQPRSIGRPRPAPSSAEGSEPPPTAKRLQPRARRQRAAPPESIAFRWDRQEMCRCHGPRSV